MICPLKIDMYCNNGTETALHAAIKGKHYDIVFALLKAGASVNTVIKAYHDINEVCITHNTLKIASKSLILPSKALF